MFNPEKFNGYLAGKLTKEISAWLRVPENKLSQTLSALYEALLEGHSCLDLSEWAGQQLFPDTEQSARLPDLDKWLADLEQLPILPEDNAPLILDNQRLYFRRYWQFECELASQLKARIDMSGQEISSAARSRLDEVMPASDKNSTWQRVAAINTLVSPLSVIAGGPGTGKTYTVALILACMLADDENQVIRLAAPTGKAAQRLNESIQQAKHAFIEQGYGWAGNIPDQATTLHRLLGVIPNRVNFRHNQENPLALDCVLIDESSMVDLPLMVRLFRALPANAKVILLGDAGQLPSVAAGSVLADLTPVPHPGYSSDRAEILELDKEYVTDSPCNYLSYLHVSRRFKDDSGIGQLAKSVLAGQVEESWSLLQQNSDQLHYLNIDQRLKTIEQKTRQYYQKICQAEFLSDAWQLLGQFRVLAATRVGPQGTLALNQLIIEILGRREGDSYKGLPVMVTRNDYQVQVFNGDIGILWPDTDNQLKVFFPVADGSFRSIPLSRLPDWEVTYAMTIHKTQGSEFGEIMMVLPDRPNRLLSRELIYTGLTRARHRVVYAGVAEVWKQSVATRVKRHSGLSDRLS